MNAFSEFRYRSSDNLQLYARDYPPSRTAGALPVVCLPGLTRNSRDFHELAVHLSQSADASRRVIAFDYRGRGQSDVDPDWTNYDVRVEAADVISGLEALGIRQAAFIGTSRGGLIILALAAMKPAMIKAAVLNDIGPVIEAEGLAQIRGYLTNAPVLRGFAQAIAHQKQVHGTAFSALSDADIERGVRAFYRQEPDRLVAEMDPALVNTVTGVDADRPLPDLWPLFDALAPVPTMAIRGENSRLLSEKTLTTMAQRHPGLEIVHVAGQGHAPFLETGDLPRRIATFLEEADRDTIGA